MWSLPENQAIFTVEQPNTEVFAPSGGWSIAVPPISPWTVKTNPEPSYRSDEGLKKRFGIELAKAANPFEAACLLLTNTSEALWISANWLNDPVVIASKDIYLKTVAFSSPPLDKEQLAAKVLALADEKILSPKLGVMVPTIDAKDRINALKLYSEILGYTGKVEIDASTKTFTHNEMVLKLVKSPDPVKEVKTINQVSNVKSEILNEASPLINLKLVGGKV